MAAWVRLPVTTPPCARGWSSLSLVDNRMLVFGGDAGGNVFLNDLYVFQFQGKVVQCTPAKVVGDIPPNVCLHTATPVGNKLYIFGGYDGVECFNFLYVLQAEVLHPGGERFVWRKLNAGGDVPSRRAGHSAIAVGAKIFVFGGKDSVGAYLGDSYLLNVDTLTWSRAVPKPPSQVCRARAYHTTCRFGQHVYVFGGVEEGGAPSNDLWTWNVDTYQWAKVMVTGEVPAGMYSQVAQELGRLMVVFGGFVGQGSLSGKTYVFNVDKRTWKGVLLKQGTAGPAEDPAPRARHSAVSLLGKVFVFGGIKPDLDDPARPPKISYCNELMTLLGFDKVDEAANAVAKPASMLQQPTLTEPDAPPSPSVPPPATNPLAKGRPGPAAASTSGSGVGGRGALGSSGPIATATRPVPVPGASTPVASSPLANTPTSPAPQRKDSIRRNVRRSIMAPPPDHKDAANLPWSGDDVFEIEAKLADGPRSTVYRGVQVRSGALLAIKEVAGAANDDAFKAEIDAAKARKHPNIASFFGHVTQDNSLWIIMDYVHGGSVRDILDCSQQPFTEEMIAHVCAGALKGLVYLHHLAMMHRAVRASNLLLTEEGTVKLSDFGLSRPVQQDSDATTPARLAPALWLAPEVIQTGRFTEKADLWALGITVIEMADLYPPHNTAATVAAALRVIPTKMSPTVAHPNKWSIELNAFVAKCVSRAPADRPSALELTQTDPLLRRAKATEALAARIAEFVALRKQREEEELAQAEAVDATGPPSPAPATPGFLAPPSNGASEFGRRSNAPADFSGTTVYVKNDLASKLADEAAAAAGVDPAVAAFLADQLSRFRETMEAEVELRVDAAKGELLQQLTTMAQQIAARDNKIRQLEAEISRLKH